LPVLAAAVAVLARGRTPRFTLTVAGLLVSLTILFGGFGMSARLFTDAVHARRRIHACAGCARRAAFRGGGIRVPAGELETLDRIRAFVGEHAGPGPLLDLT